MNSVGRKHGQTKGIDYGLCVYCRVYATAECLQRFDDGASTSSFIARHTYAHCDTVVGFQLSSRVHST